MSFGSVIGKVKDVMRGRKVSLGRGLTPDEVELASYRRRDYLDDIKKEVHNYRLHDNKQMFSGSTFDHKSTLVGRKGKVRILGNKNVFWR